MIIEIYNLGNHGGENGENMELLRRTQPDEVTPAAKGTLLREVCNWGHGGRGKCQEWSPGLGALHGGKALGIRVAH